ncbi:MAG: hypothetical protein Q7S96_03885 [bacterium]|nr:hypothetical protein [bacterium]
MPSVQPGTLQESRHDDQAVDVYPRRHHRTTRAETRVGSLVARSTSPFRQTAPQTIFYACADGRFDITADAAVLQVLRITIADRQTPEGGPGAIHECSARSPEVREALLDDLTFIIEGHRITRIVLVAHEDCVHYAMRFPDEEPDLRMARQLRDLVEVARDLTARFHFRPDAVECFYIQPENGVLAVHEVRDRSHSR